MCAQPLPPIASRLTSCPPPPPPADTHYAPYMIHPGGEFQDGSVSQWSPRLEFARKEGWLNRSIPCLGMLFGKSKLNPTGWSQQQLRAAAEELKVSTAGRRRCGALSCMGLALTPTVLLQTKFPEMPGLGFYVSAATSDTTAV